MPDLPHGWYRPKNSDHLPLSPGIISRKEDQKQRSWDSNQQSEKAYACGSLQLKPLRQKAHAKSSVWLFFPATQIILFKLRNNSLNYLDLRPSCYKNNNSTSKLGGGISRLTRSDLIWDFIL